MERVKTLILGGGVSGLSLANWLDGDDYLVLEAEQELGGYCRTVVQDGFVWDYSGHFFHFKDPEIERYLVERMGDQRVRTVVKDSRIRHGEALIDFPFQKNIHQLPKEELLDCLYDLYFKEGAGAGPPANFEEMLYAKFGRSIAEKFLIPYNEKLYACDLATLDVDAMGRFFPYADLGDIVRNFRAADNASYNATFTYPEGGAIQYIRALEAGVDPARVRLGRRVAAVDLAERVATTVDGERFAFEYLVSSAPFVRLLEMTGLPFDRATYTWNKVLVFNLGFDRKGPSGIHWIYFADRALPFYRIGFYDNIFDTDRMSLYVELGYPHDAPLDAAAVEAARERVLAGLRAVSVVDGHELVSHHHVVLDPAYVHITRGSVADVAEKKRVLALRGVHSIGRYGSWTYCSIEDNIIEARALARALNAAG
ncbi:MAG: FAD-dependent oxidoreductase [Myxococcales bacterium]|nr:FAD-dependent oxidoreductase [Myxococcales bacterium]MCB9736344.1 FAD-dependent oxidoreductase [Deltaproteobacteria bacterium]